jgi:hypothetical protein
MNFQKIIAAILAAFLLAAATPAPLLAGPSANWGAGDTLDDALSELKVGFGDAYLDWLSLPTLGVIRLRYVYFLFKNERTGTIDEHPVYCIDPTKGGAFEIVTDIGPNTDGSNTATYIRGAKVGDPKYRGILSAGYPHNDFETLGLSSREEGYYATKLALWMYIRGNDPAKLAINPAYSATSPVALRVRAAAVKIFNTGVSGLNYEPELTLKGKPSPVAKLDASGEYYVQEIEVFASGWISDDQTVQLVWGSEPPAGTVLLGTNGEDITYAPNVAMAVRSGQNGRFGKVTVKYPAAAIDPETFSPPTLKASALLPNSEIYVAYAKTNKDKYQRYLVERDPKIEMAASFVSQLSAPEPEPGDSSLRIRKVQAGTDIPLEGAVFEIRDPEGRLVYSLTTDESGIIDVELSVMGSYTVTETVPPRYHLLPQVRTQSVYVRYGETAEVTFADTPYGLLRVVKRDAVSGQLLGGAAVRIKNIVTGLAQEGYTDSSGSAVFDQLPVGGYEITEIIAPDGYALDASVHTVSVTPLSEGETSYVLTNKAKAGLRLIKFDRQTMTPIAGVTFEIWEGGKLYGTYQTDAWGEIELRNLPAGTYTAREVATVSPYVLDPTVQWIEIEDGQGYISELYFFNLQKPGLKLIKVDSETLSPLPNARFQISRVGGSFSNEYTTDAGGEIDLSALEPGAYQVRELAAPDGYLIDFGIRTIQLSAGESAQFVFTDTKKPSFELIKLDSKTGKALAGATFRIAKIEDGSHYLDRVTDTQGKIRIDGLMPGVYSAEELAAPEGYVAGAAEYHVELFPGKVSTLVVNNAQKPDLKIVKRDARTGELLEGASFKVRKADSATYAAVSTGESGEAWLYQLDPGVYEVTETLPPPGYLANDAPQLITLFPNRTGALEFANYKKPGLTILKVDEMTGLPLAGAEFSVKRKEGSVVWEGLTDERGEIHLSDLESDWYTITELAAPFGYLIANSPKDVKFTPGETIQVKFDNRPRPVLTILKRDAVTGEPLSGVKFKVQRAEGETVGEFLTDASGRIELSPATGHLLAEEIYRVTEIAPLSEYLLSAEGGKEVKLSGYEPTELIFENILKPTLIFSKTNALSGRGIDGAVYRAEFESLGGGVTSLGTYTTKCGLIVLPHVLPGWYILTEISPAPGYSLPTSPVRRVHLAPGENSYSYEQTKEDLYVDPRTNPLNGSQGPCGEWCGHLCSVLCASSCGGAGGAFSGMTITNGSGNLLGSVGGAGSDGQSDTPPVLTAASVTRVSDTRATVQFRSSEAGRYYYAAVSAGAAEPIVPTGGLGAACGADMTTAVIYLTAGAKDVYIKVKDTSGNVSAALKLHVPAYEPPDPTPDPTPATPAPSPAESAGGVIYLSPDFPGVQITFGNR